MARQMDRAFVFNICTKSQVNKEDSYAFIHAPLLLFFTLRGAN